MSRFKIDYYRGSMAPYGLYFKMPDTWWSSNNWEHLDHFSTKDEAMALYEKIKDLPEYLP